MGSVLRCFMETTKATKRKIDKIVRGVLFYSVCVILTIFFMFPIYVMISRSFMTNKEVMSITAKLWSAHPSFNAYKTALDGAFFQYLGNTALILLTHTLCVPLSCFLCAYGFSKCNFKGRDFWFAVALGCTMISGSVTGIPSFLLYVKLNLYGTYWPLIIPAFCGGGIMNIFLVRKFLLASGVTLDEAAKIDGANTLQRMFYINFPIVFPILLYIAANAFLGVWNDYKGPLIYIQDEEMYTFALGLYQKFFTGSSDLDSKANVQMATCVLMSIIPMGLFVVFQNRIIGGVQLFGAVKG